MHIIRAIAVWYEGEWPKTYIMEQLQIIHASREIQVFLTSCKYLGIALLFKISQISLSNHGL